MKLSGNHPLRRANQWSPRCQSNEIFFGSSKRYSLHVVGNLYKFFNFPPFSWWEANTSIIHI